MPVQRKLCEVNEKGVVRPIEIQISNREKMSVNGIKLWLGAELISDFDNDLPEGLQPRKKYSVQITFPKLGIGTHDHTLQLNHNG
jgi:hypothetical protein